MKHSLSIGLACVLATAFAVGCNSTAGTEKTGESSSSIINGTVDTDVHDSVVLLARVVGGQLGGVCTGTLVAQNLVLTARHCVSDTDQGALCKVNGQSYSGGAVEGDHNPNSIYVYTGKDAYGSLRRPNPPTAAARGKQLITETTNTLCDRDVAFIVLDRDVDAPIASIRLKEGAREGEMITAVGWGLTEDGDTPDKRMVRSGVEVLATGPAAFDQDTQIGIGKSEFIVGESICSGDSGGPAFASTGAVVGVVSRGGNGEQPTQSDPAKACVGSENTHNTYTHLAQKAALVQKAFDAAGAQVRDEGAPPGKAAGASCDNHVDCSSNACIAGKCATRCDEAGKCAKGQSCIEKQKKKICVSDEPEGESSSSSSSSGSSSEEENGATEETPVANAAPKTTTTTTSGCNASSSTSSNSVIGGLGLALALAAVSRRRRR